jgi:hypothetical protein
MAVKLRFRRAPVAPPMGMPESSSALREVVAVVRALRSSCARNPARRFSSAFCWRARLDSRWKLNSVTASAMALSRQRFRVRNSDVANGASRSNARSVMAWQRSP